MLAGLFETSEDLNQGMLAKSLTMNIQQNIHFILCEKQPAVSELQKIHC